MQFILHLFGTSCKAILPQKLAQNKIIFRNQSFGSLDKFLALNFILWRARLLQSTNRVIYGLDTNFKLGGAACTLDREA